ncbi:hypothetical protein [Limosilactobacillus caecicola]|uniref:hypothetical protein n=1 Tax=Limosilactobacillus caecicola TaxID=2941332 RepID=UPI00203C4560|nr:hypothetical protein [Limosilactobacillus caecicola]
MVKLGRRKMALTREMGGSIIDQEVGTEPIKMGGTALTDVPGKWITRGVFALERSIADG